MRSTTAQKPATTPIPVQLSATEFTTFIVLHLSRPKRGPQCKRKIATELSTFRGVESLLFWALIQTKWPTR